MYNMSICCTFSPARRGAMLFLRHVIRVLEGGINMQDRCTMGDHAHVHLDCGRRQLLHNVLAGAVVGIAAHAGSELAAPPTLHAQTPLTPDAALHELLAGNQ